MHFPRPIEPEVHGEKVTKETAEYKKGTAFHRCGICSYKRGYHCVIVFGFIEPYMGCKYFERKGENR